MASFSSYTGKTRTFADFMIFSSLPAASKGRTASNTFTQHLLHLKINKRKSNSSGVGAAPRGERSRGARRGAAGRWRRRFAAAVGSSPARRRSAGREIWDTRVYNSGQGYTAPKRVGLVRPGPCWPLSHPGDTGGILCSTQEGRSWKAKASVRPGAVIQHVYKQKPHISMEILTCLQLMTYFLTCCLKPAAFSQVRI